MKREAIVAVIPARMSASRFPGKPLAWLRGRPMIEHVYRRTKLCASLDEVYIATCDEEIAAAARAFGAKTVMTSPKHERATDRVAEAARGLRADIIVMVQGDEPMIQPGMIAAALEPFGRDPGVVCTNLAAPICSESEFRDPNTIKVVMRENGDALYFSRQPIPTDRRLEFSRLQVYKQVCVIPFRRDFLQKFSELAPTPLENSESIDMLRALEHGFQVRLVKTDIATHAVDTLDDLNAVEALMARDEAMEIGKQGS